MLKIKLARFGKRSQPEYRFVVTEARSKRDGKYLVKLGHYSPTRNPKILELDLEAYDNWMKKGAQPTETVASLAKRLKSGNPFPAKKKKLSKKAKAKLEAAAQEKAEAKATAEAEKKAAKVEKAAAKTEDKAPVKEVAPAK